ncbi:MAG: PorT family protein [Prevotella sp.]|nr:PorT family protein [Prevotella sp.]
MRKVILLLLLAISGLLSPAFPQERKAQYKPYIDLRPLHLGILVGMNLQDIELENVGPQTVTLEDGTTAVQTISCDADRWNMGFSVGVLADLRLSKHLNLRFSPTMHFGAKHLTFQNLTNLDSEGRPELVTQQMKNTYISFPIDLKFSAERWNNHRPYLMAGVNPMLNLTGKDQDYIQLKRSDLYLEIGMGCDFYLPFFKLIPELKFCYSLSNALDKGHAAELQDVNKRMYTNSVSAGHTKMIVLTLYFE